MSIVEKEIITSKNNPTVVRLSKLGSKKYRELEGLFTADGEKLFFEALGSGLDVKYVVMSRTYAQSAGADKIRQALERANYTDVTLLTLADDVFEKITAEKSPQGIITVAKTIDFSEKYNKIYNNEKFFTSPRNLVMLSDIQDPGNLGTVLRCAAAFELDALLVCKGCVDLFSPKTVRGAMGALFKQPVKTAESAVEEIRALRASGVKVYAAALDRNATELDRLKLSPDESVCFVIGNEGNGLGQEVIDECDGTVFIPMSANTESLNASVASAVFMWELFKNRRK